MSRATLLPKKLLAVGRDLRGRSVAPLRVGVSFEPVLDRLPRTALGSAQASLPAMELVLPFDPKRTEEPTSTIREHRTDDIAIIGHVEERLHTARWER